MEIPVYLFTGFLDSGKTSFIQDTISDPDFLADDLKDYIDYVYCL